MSGEEDITADSPPPIFSNHLGNFGQLKLFTHIASLVYSAPRNWGYKGRIRTGPIGLTD